MKMIPHHAEGQHIHPTKPRLFTQDFKEHPLRLIIEEKLPTSRPTRDMVDPHLILNQVPPPKTSRISHPLNIKT
jgi:hypothetical protein